MEVFHIEDQLNLVSHLEARARINPGDKVVLAAHQVQEDFIAHQLGHIHFGFNRRSDDSRRSEHGVVNIFRANAKDDFFTSVWGI